MATITFDKTGDGSTKWIQLGVGDVSTDAQELANAIRDWQDEIENHSTPNFLASSGKTLLKAGTFTGITLIIDADWKIRADPTFGSPTTVVIEGDIVSADGTSPFYPVTNVSYDRGLSTAPSIQNLTTVENNQGSILDLLVNDSEWVAPGVVNVYDDNGKTGGVVIYQWKTYDADGIQSNTKAPKRLERIDPPVQP